MERRVENDGRPKSQSGFSSVRGSMTRENENGGTETPLTYSQLVEMMNRKFGLGNWRKSTRVRTETSVGYSFAKATTKIYTRKSTAEEFTLMFEDEGLVSVKSGNAESVSLIEKAADLASTKSFMRAASGFGGELSAAWPGKDAFAAARVIAPRTMPDAAPRRIPPPEAPEDGLP